MSGFRNNSIPRPTMKRKEAALRLASATMELIALAPPAGARQAAFTITRTVVAHSLGGSTALRLQKEMSERDFEVTTYGAPVMGFFGGNNTRYRHPLDPISMFDMSPFTKSVPVLSINPLTTHSYKGYTYDYDKGNLAPKFPINQAPPSNELTQQITIPKNVNSVSANNSYQIS